jgi:hypothetical protein
MFDPVTMNRLAQIRQQEILEQAACDREARITLIQWSRLLEPVQAFLQRRSRSGTFQPTSAAFQTLPGHPALDECPCE